MSSEVERVAALRTIYGGAHPGVALSVGDDAAVLDDGTVLSVDASIEDVHFRRAWIGRGATWADIGYRATIAALSDLAAMAATPTCVLSALALPADLEDAVLFEIARGIAAAAEVHRAPVIGGNLSRAREIGITTTVVGRAQRALRRDGAKVGDAIWVTGTLGAATLGLTALESDVAGDAALAPYVRRFLAPTARVAEALAIGRVATAAIDVSDGLISDLVQLVSASGVGATIDVEAIPREPGHHAVAHRLGRDPIEALVAGGEDYELLFIAPGSDVVRELATRIGTVAPGVGVTLRDARGATIASRATGHDHFR